MDDKDFRRFMIPIVILILAVLSFLIVKPIASAVIIGLLLAYVSYPIYLKINKKIKSNNLSAFIIVGVVLLVVLLPIIFLIPRFTEQLLDSYVQLRGADFSKIIFQIFPSLAESKEMTAEIIAASSHFSGSISSWILSIFDSTFRNIPGIAFGAVVLLFTFFFSLREGQYVKDYFSIFFPFQEQYQKKFYEKFEQVTYSVIYGEIVVGIAQGLIAGIGYYMFGIPNALLFIVLTTVAAILPVIGPWLIWIPLDISLFISGDTTRGMQLLIYGLFVINWIDTLLRPIIIAKKAEINEAIALIGAIGGIYAFGFIGFLLGPLILAYFILLIEVYKGSKESIIIKEPKEPESKSIIEEHRIGIV
jgi:predicted PurR-regulated permease PerM